MGEEYTESIPPPSGKVYTPPVAEVAAPAQSTVKLLFQLECQWASYTEINPPPVLHPGFRARQNPKTVLCYRPGATSIVHEKVKLFRADRDALQWTMLDETVAGMGKPIFVSVEQLAPVND